MTHEVVQLSTTETLHGAVLFNSPFVVTVSHLLRCVYF